MYAQLCLRLNDFVQSEDQLAGNFRKLLLHKCQEEFENHRRTNAAFTSRRGLSPDEQEQRAVAKRKMLGNIKFVGELYKLGVLHEAIIHSCIKELLERKKGQSVEDTSKNMECLCHFMTTVGSKLDTEKAKGWMDQYFSRMKDWSTNKELPSRIRFMLMDVIELRGSKWVPRRAVAKKGPRPLHLIHHEAYQENQSSLISGGRGQMGPLPPATQLEQGYRGQAVSPYAPPPGASGDEGFTSSPYMRDHLLSPQDHTSMSFPPQPGQPPLLQSPLLPGDSAAVTTGAKTPEKKNFRKFPGKSDSTVSLRPAMKSMKLGSTAGRSKPTTPLSTPDHTHPDSLAPDSERPQQGTTKSAASAQKSVIPRTRDDSSDEEDRPLTSQTGPLKDGAQSLMGHAPILPHPSFPGSYPPMPHPHMMPPPPRGLPEHYYPPHHPGRGLVGPAPLPPRSSGGGILSQPPPPMMYMNPGPLAGGGMARVPGGPPMSQYGGVPPGQPLPPGMSYYYSPPMPHGPPGSQPPVQGFVQSPVAAGGPVRGGGAGHPFVRPGGGGVMGYGPLHTRVQPQYPGNQPWTGLPPQQERPTTKHEHHKGEKSTRPPNLERNEPVIKYKSGKKTGSGKKLSVQDEKEKLVEPLIKSYLKSRDVDVAVDSVEEVLKSLSKEGLCLLLISKTLDKSEDERTHMSGLLQELFSKEIITPTQVMQTFTTAINSAQCKSSQNKTYLAGFIARAIAKDVVSLRMVAPMFDQGAHYPTVLVVLQALTSLLGETEVHKQFKDSSVKLASLLPVEYRSHAALSELMESKHLGFLYPLKLIQTELSARLSQDCPATVIYKWIKTNVDSSLYPTPDFVMVLTRCILEHVSHSGGRADSPNKAKEKDCMEKYKILIQKFVSDNLKLQVSVLHATQVFCHDRQFPKGLLLRLFSYLYDMDVIEDESFFKWKEDVPLEFPGKGQALFQVNQWLVLLAESDEEGSSEEEA